MQFHGPPQQRPARAKYARSGDPMKLSHINALLRRAADLSHRFPPGTECVVTVKGDLVTTAITGEFSPCGEHRVVVKVAGLAEPVDAREVWVGGRRATDDDPLPRVDANGGGNGSEVG